MADNINLKLDENIIPGDYYIIKLFETLLSSISV